MKIRPCRRLLHATLIVATAALTLVVNLPHRHDHASFSHQSHTCRACRMQEQFSATAVVPAVLVPTLPLFESIEQPVVWRPTSRPIVHAAPRSPPYTIVLA